mgnify:CR=1 FL=1
MTNFDHIKIIRWLTETLKDEMILKKGIKTLAMWLIIGIIVIVLLSSIMENSSSKMTYSELVTSMENKEVESIKISSEGNVASVKLKNSKTEKEVKSPLLLSLF